MIVREISKELFDSFSSVHPLGSLYQTSAYAGAMESLGYKPLYLGAFIDGNLKAASLVLTKTLAFGIKYGYSPRGFLVDYFDKELFYTFTKEMKSYFFKRGYAFVKINPIITYSEINKETKNKTLSSTSSKLYDTLLVNGYKRLKDNIYFESMLPKYNAIVDLNSFSIESINEKLKNRIKKLKSKGLNIYKTDIYEINKLYELIKRKTNIPDTFYKSLYKNFSIKNNIDLFLVEQDYHDYLINLQGEHILEENVNEKINLLFQKDPTNKGVLNEKMSSDRRLSDIEEEITFVNQKIQSGSLKETIAGALVIKNKNVATIYISGFDKAYSKVLPNHFMHYKLLDYYKKEGFKFVDLNGITGDFTKTNPYKGLNEFKLSFNPRLFEYIGEFDLIVNPTLYSILYKAKILHKEFDKKGLKNKF